jgi:hypothetical protein
MLSPKLFQQIGVLKSSLVDITQFPAGRANARLAAFKDIVLEVALER